MKTFLAILLLTSGLCFPLSAEQQLTFSFAMNDDESQVGRLDLHQRFSGDNWQTTLITSLKNASATDGDNYLCNYLRERFLAGYTTEDWSVDAWAGGEFYWTPNRPLHVPGWSGSWEPQNVWHGGADLRASLLGLDWQFYTDGSLQQFETDDGTDETDASTRSIVRSSMQIGLWEPYVRFEHWEDFNESDLYDATLITAGAIRRERINYQHYLIGEAALTSDNTFDSDDWTLRLKARLVSKFGLDVSLVNRLDVRIQTQNQDHVFQTGDSFLESRLRYTIGYDDRNWTDHLEFSLRHHLPEGIQRIGVGGRYTWWLLFVTAEADLMNGDDLPYDYRLEGALGFRNPGQTDWWIECRFLSIPESGYAGKSEQIAIYSAIRF